MAVNDGVENNLGASMGLKATGGGRICYRERLYKYVLAENYDCAIGFRPPAEINTAFISFRKRDGRLFFKTGYAWDGPSGPTVDTRNFMRGSLIHDALYQLIREGHLPPEMREAADLELWRICREDGMSAVRAWYVWRSVRIFGGPSALGSGDIFLAPRKRKGGGQSPETFLPALKRRGFHRLKPKL